MRIHKLAILPLLAVLAGCGAPAAPGDQQAGLPPRPTATPSQAELPPRPTATPPIIDAQPTEAPTPPIIDAQPPDDQLPVDAQPHIPDGPEDAVKLLLISSRDDRSGRSAASYLGGELRAAVLGGSLDVGGMIGEQNPFLAFQVDSIIGNDDRFTYVQATLLYGSDGSGGVPRIFSVSEEEDGMWKIFKVSPLDEAPAVSDTLPDMHLPLATLFNGASAVNSLVGGFSYPVILGNGSVGQQIRDGGDPLLRDDLPEVALDRDQPAYLVITSQEIRQIAIQYYSLEQPSAEPVVHLLTPTGDHPEGKRVDVPPPPPGPHVLSAVIFFALPYNPGSNDYISYYWRVE